MSFTTALYEGDSVIHFAPCVRAAVKTRGRTPGQDAKTLGVTQLRHSLGKRRTRRGAIEVLFGAIWNALRSVGLWIEEKSREAQYREVESYLTQSSNHADLERRLRVLEHSNRFNWIGCRSR